MNPKVDQFLSEASTWQAEITLLRTIVLDSELTEDYKWMHPCYTLGDKNVVLIHGFKHYCALLFHNGALLKDPNGILIQQTKNVQSARQIRFTDIDQIKSMESVIRSYICEAIDIQKSGLKIDLKKASEYEVSTEFRRKLDESPRLKASFEALTPGRQRAYLLYFAQPKQAKTCEARIGKCIPQILNKKGLHD